MLLAVRRHPAGGGARTPARNGVRITAMFYAELSKPGGYRPVTQTTGWSPPFLRIPPEQPYRSRARSAVAWLARTPEVLVGLLGLAVFTWRVGTPSAWWDEAITRDVVTRPTGDIVSLVSGIDLV